MFTLIIIPSTFAEPHPIKSIEIFSKNLNYQNEEAGAWKVTKSAKWKSKGEAEITFNIDSIKKVNSKATDILLVLDVSNTIDTEEFQELKSSSIGLINNLLTNTNNRIGLITFDTSSTILSNFTNNKEDLINKINTLDKGVYTNYYQALVNVNEVMKTYTKEKGRECVVLFIVGGYPSRDTPNEVGQYNFLKSQYPYLTINGIQYEMGTAVVKQVSRISDYQYTSTIKTLSSVLNEAMVTSMTYDNFKIEDYIDTNYFSVDSEMSIKANQGKVKFDKTSQKIEWELDSYKSGAQAQLTIRAKLKSNLEVENNMYLTNTREIISSKIDEVDENVESNKTPILTDTYKVTYDGNLPSECSVDNIPEENYYSVFDTVELSNEKLVCEGYQFKKWEITTKGVTKLNDDYFTMPEADVEIKGVWSKLEITTSLTGTVRGSLTLYKQVEEDSNNPSKYAKKYTGDTSTFNGNADIYYYYGAAANNNVLFADYCWKIVRTTDTGGVKLLYNGVPNVDGECRNTGDASQLTAEQMNLSTNEVAFNEQFASPVDVGYMYNNDTRYTYKNYFGGENKNYEIIRALSVPTTTNYYYADTINFENSQYSLENSEQYSWKDTYKSLEGKYTLRNSSSTYKNSVVYYIVKAEPTRMYCVEIKNSSGYEETITLSISITDNEDGTYTLSNPITIKKADWYTKYNDYVNYYTCGSNELTCSGEDLMYSLYNDQTVMRYVKKDVKYKYGNSFEWDGENYTLKDTIDIWNPYEDNILDNNHYTCFNSSGVCQFLAYVYYTDNTAIMRYIELNDGKSANDALNEMLYNENVNKSSSTIKQAIDYWYFNNMTDYTQYLEDTVWCNDRSMSNQSANGWNPNGGSTTTYMYFKSYSNSNNLTCENMRDRFTIDEANGNGKLDYPVGLITRQEQVLAYSSSKSPLATGNSYWGLSPSGFSTSSANVYLVGTSGNYSGYGVSGTFGARPAVSLQPGIEYSKGNGTGDSPYKIDLGI